MQTIITIKKRILVLTEMLEEYERLLSQAEQDLEDEMFPVKTIEENEAIEMEQLIDEIKNPDDYVSSDTKDLESSIV